MARSEMTIREAERILSIMEPYRLEDLSKKYRACAKESHPDLGGTEEEMQRVNEAYECLRSLFDATNAEAKRMPMSPAGSRDIGRRGTSAGRDAGVETSRWDSIAEASGIPFDDFVAIMMEYERRMREDEERIRGTEEMRNGAGDGSAQSGVPTDKSETGEADGETTIGNPNRGNESRFARFRHKAARIFAGLCHLPYGIAALVFFEWQAFSANRPMNSMFDGVGMLLDIIFEVFILAPLLAWVVRTAIRAILRKISTALSK